MVKQSPFQKDLFDLTYIEDQVAKIKQEMNKKNSNNEASASDDSNMSMSSNDESNLYEMLKVHEILLKDIQQQLEQLNSKSQKRWFKR